ncbi:DUF2065 domain-containing protein [Marinimicrococcus flavescens]|uniref:DUF2065 domain-containing protein n=1 Tax=Marinimicrococcus flavescens TaxID=3031815 RepID=A0AAP3XRI1_9PROT|nr:DUF2065 domain-containing protein [Marinimicrococcus flavescens]
MQDLLTAAALVLVIEGVLWSLFPHAMRRAAQRAAELDPGQLRAGGLLFAALGVLGIWFIRG